MSANNEEFWQEKDIEMLAREQGVKPVADPDELFGAGSDLWKDDGEFEDFLVLVRELSHATSRP